MTAEKKVARRKLSLLQLASELNNVSKACQLMGYSRQQFYEIRRNFQTFGSQGLLDRIAGAKSPHPNRLPKEIEEAILNYSLDFPTHGPLRVSQELALREIHVSSGGVRGVWKRHDLLTKHQRLLRLEEHARKSSFKLNDHQVALLERFEPEFRERHIEAPFSGALVAVDTFHVGYLKGVGRIYAQTAIDCHSRFAFARLYTSKMPLTSVHLLNNDILPFFEERNVPIKAILSDNGREFCGRPDKHPYELFLQLEDIQHKTTQVRRPQSNGFLERFHRTLLDECLRIQGRKTWFEDIHQLQTTIDSFLHSYNFQRPHQGRGMNGKTPFDAFNQGSPTNPDVDSKKSAA